MATPARVRSDKLLDLVSDEKKEEIKNRLFLLIYGYARRTYGLPETAVPVPNDIMHVIRLYAREKEALESLQSISKHMGIDFKTFERMNKKHQSWWAWYKSPDFQNDLIALSVQNKLDEEYSKEDKEKDKSFFAKIFGK